MNSSDGTGAARAAAPDAAAIAGGRLDFDPQDIRRVRRWTRFIVFVILLLMAAGAARTVLGRLENARQLEAEARERALPFVKTDVVKRVEGSQRFVLPGTLQGFMQAPVAARAGGYLRRWHKDIGSEVRKGDLLAEIDSPELDRQLAQAIAARSQIAASVELARSTLERWEGLRTRDAVSQQDLDERRSALVQARANLAATDANVDRLRELEKFKRVTAPFAGVITRRNIDVGDLIDGSGRPLFLMTQSDPLRVFVSVPQAYALGVRIGQTVEITQPGSGARKFKGEVARTAASIDAATRTMQVEVQLPNPDGRLLPGAFVQVALAIDAPAAVRLPAAALIFRKEGIRVATLNAQGEVKLAAVQIGRNFGESVEVLDGLSGNERIVLNPADSISDGDRVRVAEEPKKPAPKAAH